MSKEFHTSSSVPTVIVVIPIYTTALSDAELSALRHNLRVLASHDTAVVKPESLDLTPLYTALGMEPSWRVESFPDEFFAGRKGYNRLMLSEVFYERFLAWEYLLIMQTDVYVFSDRLDAWCARGYDYVGAPWLPSIREVTGFHPMIFRFPGGSAWGRDLLPGATDVIEELGYQWVDWNCNLYDAGAPENLPSSGLEITRALTQIPEEPIAMILGHDWNANTLVAMKTAIPELMDQGYVFLPLFPESVTMGMIAKR